MHTKLHKNLFISTCSLHWNIKSSSEVCEKPVLWWKILIYWMYICCRTEQHLEFLSLKGVRTGSSESTLFKMHIFGNRMSQLKLANIRDFGTYGIVELPQTSLNICAISTEPFLLAGWKYNSKGRPRPKYMYRLLASSVICSECRTVDWSSS